MTGDDARYARGLGSRTDHAFTLNGALASRRETNPPTATGMLRLGIVIPALNEADTVGVVVRDILDQEIGACLRVVVADNGSTDETLRMARQAGAEVVSVPRPGYGRACLAAVEYLSDWPEILLFMDADGSSLAREIPSLLSPLLEERVDLVIGRRPDQSAMTLPQKWGTQLATQLIRFLWRHHYQDMGPFRAIRFDAYRRLGMRDQTWGWTVEMQILALQKGLRVEERPVSWLPRQAGTSKISGTVSGVARAGVRILWTIALHGIRENRLWPGSRHKSH